MPHQIPFDELSDYTITTGEVFGNDDFFFVTTNDERLEEDPEDDHSFYVRYSDDNMRILETWPVRSQARSSSDDKLIVSMSPRGNIRQSVRGKGGRDEATIYESLPHLKATRTMLNEVFDVFGDFYAIGTRRAIYRRLGPDQWEDLGEGCYDAKNFAAEFTGLVGVDGKVLYAVGALGEIWRYDGQWTQENSGTDQNLNAACVDHEGMIYAVGSNGTLLRGKDGTWVQAGDPGAGFEYWSVAEYQGEIYLTANLSLVLKLNKEDGTLTPVDYGDCDIPLTAYHLKVRDGLLYCFGPKNIFRFDGSEWEEILAL